MAKRRKRKLKKKFVLFVWFIILLGLSSGCFFLYKTGKISFGVGDKPVIKNPFVFEEKKLELDIIDLESDSRPIAVMINNHPSARNYHRGLQDAYLVYEIIVEGGYTRYMAVFKDKNLESVGSIRSSRHYFLDYALENDAIYVHWGWSPEAEKQIDSYNVDNINGLTLESKYFYRDNSLNVSYEHRGFTSSELINKAITGLKYRNTSDKETLLNYTDEEIDLSKMDDAVVANNINISYSGLVKTGYVYDATNKVYNRYVNGKEHSDYITKKQFTTKNIITYEVSNHTLTGDVKGRQDIDNIGTGNGYYITNGYAVPITWEKKYKAAQTVYKFMDGREINVNDGNTYIQIHPKNNNSIISE